ncbi:hypothetical protein PHLGIDRAFT_99899 [Phlebiopsis gigantea 11061_1 CR5-6]|uniref:mRNA export factor GLE1 n=1 Tax=Phlebiopsis gigantea (strain 11061_1 CR5-6) TaxID=745531 RepID=A0A0C3P0N0_PHLG1|nr:hypothetical protein PHLGIDRAFT_99899 [Phlebiopsis gigantea 11061_1 CR5-6]
MEDMVASIKLRVTHRDAYEEWEHQTRKDAFLSARHEQAEHKARQKVAQSKQHIQVSNARATLHQRQLDEVQTMLGKVRVYQQKQENDYRAAWSQRNQAMKNRVETAIKLEEQKIQEKLEAERKQKEEAERRRKEEEEKARLEQERKLQEELKKRKEAEEKQKQQEREEEEKKQQAEAEKQKAESDKQNAEQEQSRETERKALGMSTPAEDWAKGRDLLKRVKTKPMPVVKGNKEMKKVWSAGRRAITPKIGQLTNDPQSISRITTQIIEVIMPTPPHPKPIYFALLSSLAKSILLQAETEVTAEKRSAVPLAQVTANLLGALERFPDVFWAKLCQRAGGWPVPFVVPVADFDGTPFDAAAQRKAMGYRDRQNKEGIAEYKMRVAGMMRVYFHVLVAPVAQPLDSRFRSHRVWTYFVWMLSDERLLASALSAELLYVALDVNGAGAKAVWGAQWTKLLEVLYEGCTAGLYGNPAKLIGGTTPEGISARVRVQGEIEKLMAT